MNMSHDKTPAASVGPANQTPDLAKMLEQAQKKPRRGRTIVVWLLLLLLIFVGAYYWYQSRGQGAINYLTSPVTRGELVVTATATGTIQPTRTVEVGSELSGTLEAIFVNENDTVQKGQLLAVLDTARLNDAIAKSSAALAAAQAQVLLAQATVSETRATFGRLQAVFKLSKGKVPSESELEVADAMLKRALANENAAKASVMQAAAELKTNKTNLQKGQITSPVDGVVLTREVEPGNTVVAAMSTPILFTIAENLTKMELQVQVDEADVASVRPGQTVTFTVAAWPGRQFPANIERVGLGSTTTDNVVTYKTILSVDNDDLALRPGMTASATIIVAERQDVLLVPNAALRYVPLTGETSQTAMATRANTNQVWSLEQDKPKSIEVQAGISNGRFTEIVSGDLTVDDLVVIGQERAK
jgi:HlyD family secretion protein